MAAAPSPAPVAEQAPVTQNEPTPPAPVANNPVAQQQPAPETASVAPISQEGVAPQTPLANESMAEAPPLTSSGPVSWTASEFIAHDKSPNWYILLFGGAVIAAGLVWLVTKDIVSSAVILVAVAVLAAYSSRKPRELQYTLDDHGIIIGEKHYAYTTFRSFSVIEEGAFSSIELMPLKRFSPPISVYYDPANEDAIADALTPHLPFHPHEPDPVDKLI